jgi:ATP-dependent exoDNAse (exonuclease V) beta subunit
VRGRRLTAASASVQARGTEALDTGEPAAPSADEASELSPRERALSGTAIHRLLQRQEDPGVDDSTLAASVSNLLTPEERVDVEDLAAFSLAAARTYRAFRSRPDVESLLNRGTPYFEVPFSFVRPGRPDELVRGIVDCLIVGPEQSATVLEFKTGRAHPEHQAQAAFYAEAVAAILGIDPDKVAVNVLYS